MQLRLGTMPSWWVSEVYIVPGHIAKLLLIQHIRKFVHPGVGMYPAGVHAN